MAPNIQSENLAAQEEDKTQVETQVEAPDAVDHIAEALEPSLPSSFRSVAECYLRGIRDGAASALIAAAQDISILNQADRLLPVVSERARTVQVVFQDRGRQRSR